MTEDVLSSWIKNRLYDLGYHNAHPSMVEEIKKEMYNRKTALEAIDTSIDIVMARWEEDDKYTAEEAERWQR